MLTVCASVKAAPAQQIRLGSIDALSSVEALAGNLGFVNSWRPAQPLRPASLGWARGLKSWFLFRHLQASLTLPSPDCVKTVRAILTMRSSMTFGKR